MPRRTAPASGYGANVPHDEPFARWDASGWVVEDEEPGGADPKLWLRDADGQRWLFKPVTVTSNGNRQGEDWSEKAAAEIAGHLGVPCARVELASRGGVEGSLSLNVRPRNCDMHSGATFLSAMGAPDFTPARQLLDNRDPRAKRRPGHSLTNIRASLVEFGPPSDLLASEGLDAFDVFAGYLLLDALIANRDRHDENWSVLVPTAGAGAGRLAPSYDQAGGLAFNLTDEKRHVLLQQGRPAVEAYAEKGTAWRFESKPGAVASLVRHASDALELASPAGRSHWITRFEALRQDGFDSILTRLDGMSDLERRFASDLLRINTERLRDECHDRDWL